MSGWLRLALAVVAIAGGGLGLSTIRETGPTSAAVPPVSRYNGERPEPAPSVTRWGEALPHGGRLADWLIAQGLSSSEVSYLTDLVRPHANPDALLPDTRVAVRRTSAGQPSAIDVQLDPDRTLRFELNGARWSSHLDSVPVSLDTIAVTGSFDRAWWAPQLTGDTDGLQASHAAELIEHLAAVFGGTLDLYQSLRVGDRFRVVAERHVRPDRSTRGLRLIAAELHHDGQRLTGIRFAPATGQGSAFYDMSGRPLAGGFLRSPLGPARVTSAYSRARFHPILRSPRAHLGVDYGAPYGTPVRATGRGRVVRAGWWGEFGRLVEIRHDADTRTRYAHLSQIASQLAPGVAVDQGTIIGRVGASGLATGAHLHYEILVRGRPVDPSDAVQLQAPPIPEGRREQFDRARERASELLATLDG
jgi:murein DD-endopeptidase MepM/ murein hydrolase activator NlpD